MLEFSLLIFFISTISALIGKGIFWYLKKYQLSDMTHIDAMVFYWKAIGNLNYLVSIGAMVLLIVIWVGYFIS